LEDHGGRIELHDASEIRPGARGAWMRLRFAVSGHAPAIEIKEPVSETNDSVPEIKASVDETKSNAAETDGRADETNEQTKIETATGD
jgi:two-component system nitrogen regulation sensor histidine kinase NtrY